MRSSALAAAALLCAAAARAGEFSMSPGWTARAATVFAGVGPQASAWRGLGEAGAAFDFRRPYGQALAYALEARGVDAGAYRAMSPAQRQAERDAARDDIGHSVFELAALTARSDLNPEELGAVSSDLGALTGRLASLLDKDQLRIAGAGLDAARGLREGRTMDSARDIAGELEQDKRDGDVRLPTRWSDRAVSAELSKLQARGEDADPTAVERLRRAPMILLDDLGAPSARYDAWMKVASEALAVAALVGANAALYFRSSGAAALVFALIAAGFAGLAFAVNYRRLQRRAAPDQERRRAKLASRAYYSGWLASAALAAGGWIAEIQVAGLSSRPGLIAYLAVLSSAAVVLFGLNSLFSLLPDPDEPKREKRD